jgi:hypothetical protein
MLSNTCSGAPNKLKWDNTRDMNYYCPGRLVLEYSRVPKIQVTVDSCVRLPCKMQVKEAKVKYMNFELVEKLGSYAYLTGR